MQEKKTDKRGEGNCRTCDNPTSNIFNIGFAPTYICEQCATAIFIQQAQWYAKKAITNSPPIG